MLACVMMFTSCLKDSDNDNTQYYNDTAIATFKLATVNRYVHTTTSAGKDSVYKKTLSDPVVFTIDQAQHKIYNTDSLPSDVDLNHVLATITSKNSGTIVLNYGKDSLMYYSSTDSIDFEQLEDLRVYAQDGSGYRSYELSINVHKAQTGKMLWEQKSAADLPAVDPKKAMWEQIAATAGMKQLIGYGTTEGYAFSNEGLLMVSRDNGNTWKADSLDEDAAWLPKDNVAFVSWPFAANDSTDYQLMIGTNDKSDVCVVWRKIAEYAKRSLPSKWVMIPAADQGNYYLPKMDNLNLVRFNNAVVAIGNDKKMYVSRDQGITWKTSSKYQLPDELGTSNVSAMTDENGYLWLVGNDTGEVWRGLIIE